MTYKTRVSRRPPGKAQTPSNVVDLGLAQVDSDESEGEDPEDLRIGLG